LATGQAKNHQSLSRLVPKKSPPYQQSILQDYIPGRACSFCNLICECCTKTATGARAFGVVAPEVWHDQPDIISSDSIT